ncbi:MAG: phosphatidylserine decarboxylase family protein [Pyrinomonadaceae bacterium]
MKIVREGLPFILAPLLLAGVLLVLNLWHFALLLVVISLFMAFFFRNPERIPPNASSLVVAPADGHVTRIASVSADDKESGTVVSIFLSPFDVHINRSPIAGRITDISYIPGKFLMATNEKASLVNEQNVLTIEGSETTVVCKQIAGILARRVVCWKRKGDNLKLGERFGMIKFSSRTDLILPANVKVIVEVGARVRGGTTVIGQVQ